MIDAKLQLARELIQQKEYSAARSVLEKLDHPTAYKWLEKLDEIAPVSKRKRDELDDDFPDFPTAAHRYPPTPIRAAAYEPKSYTNTAILVLILYWLMWLPGLIINVVTLNQAKEEERRTGRKPEGMGCLTTMLWVNGLLFVGGFLLIMLTLAAGG